MSVGRKIKFQPLSHPTPPPKKREGKVFTRLTETKPSSQRAYEAATKTQTPSQKNINTNCNKIYTNYI
jgi:hypothetical protein